MFVEMEGIELVCRNAVSADPRLQSQSLWALKVLYRHSGLDLSMQNFTYDSDPSVVAHVVSILSPASLWQFVPVGEVE